MIEIRIERFEIERLSTAGLYSHLVHKGLNVYKPCERNDLVINGLPVIIFTGQALPEKIIGCIKTVVGLVPITEPWGVCA